MGDLQSQLDKLQKLMQLKDAQLARLQASAANQVAKPEGEEAVTQAPATVATSPESNPEVQPVLPSVEQSTPGSVVERGSTTPNATAQTVPEQPSPESETSAPSVPVAEAPAAEQTSPPAMPVTPVPVQSPEQTEPLEQESSSFLEQIFGNTLWLGVIGGSALLALLVLLMVISRRNAMREAEHEAALEEEQSIGTYRVDPDIHESSLDGLDISDLSDNNFDQQDSDPKPASDALGQADIYMAYGRFNQAADVLQKASDEEPHRADLRLKLMEVYAEMGDRDGFIRQENELREIGGSQSEVEHLKSRYPAMAAAAAATALGAAALAAAHEVSESENEHRLEDESATDKLNDDFDLNFDDFKLDETEETSAAREDDNVLDFTPVEADARTAQDDDFDFDFDLSNEEEHKPTESASLNDEFSLDLDESETKPLHTTTDEPVVQQPEDELSLDLPESETKSSNVHDLSDDFDLSVDEPVVENTSAVQEPVDHSFGAELERANADLASEELKPEESKDEQVTDFGALAADSGNSLDDDFDFLSGEDETATKLDLARAYIDMGDADGARDILDEILTEGSDAQRNEAREMLAQLS
jgi:pilus assembly protein FimV